MTETPNIAQAPAQPRVVAKIEEIEGHPMLSESASRLLALTKDYATTGVVPPIARSANQAMTLDFHPIPPDLLPELRRRYEFEQPDLWQPWAESSQTPHLLPYQHGDGKKAVALSFYAAPECVIVVLIDSSLPVELPDHTRHAPNPPPAFRDLLDHIYDLCEDTWDEPPCGDFRLTELRENRDDDYDYQTPLWSIVIDEGSTWTAASFLATRPGSQEPEILRAGL